MEKKKLLVSFSGGETSAYMAVWLWQNMRDEYDIIFVFANTGFENEETLVFIKRFSEHFNIPIVWVEAVINPINRKGTTHKVVDFYTANRDGSPFEAMAAKYGLPNSEAPHCTRELKEYPIKSYARSLGWKKYYTAIGIREDEPKRVNKNAHKKRLLYPLVHLRPMTKAKINFWWSQQPFRLELKGYQGNCVTCWKKSDNKLYQIAKENEKAFLFFTKLELRYDKFVPESRLLKMKERGEIVKLPIRMFRKERTAEQIVNESKEWNGKVYDDARIYENQIDLLEALQAHGQSNESCEVFTKCVT